MEQVVLWLIFQLPLPDFSKILITRADVVPKLGAMSVNLDVLVDPAFQPLNVSTNNNLYTGIEVGLERDLLGLRFRLWGGYDFSGALIAEEDSVKSLKVGGDIAYEAMEFKSTKVDSSNFLNAERLSLEKGEENPEATTINDISFNLAFLGVGAALSW